MFSEIFENSFLKNGLLKIWSDKHTIYVLTYSSNDNNSWKMFTRIVIMSFRKKSENRQ